MFNKLKYDGLIIRPPSEADSLILQVTVGCSDNGCTFCPAYKQKQFRIKDVDDIKKNIDIAVKHYSGARKIFLADGDAMVIEQQKLLEILKLINTGFPSLKRIGIYASAKSLRSKTIEDLKVLKGRGLAIVYLGIETGDSDVYNNIKKWGSPEDNIRECLKVKESGIKLNTTVVLGLGGKALTKQHAVNTAKVLNSIKPDHVAALTLMVVNGTEISREIAHGRFQMIDDIETVAELYLLIKNMEDFKCLFFSNHASNYFPISARFPKDKKLILKEVEDLLEKGDRSILRDERLRGL